MGGPSKRNGRTRAERKAVDDLKAQRQQPCRRCGQPIDYRLVWPDPGSFSAGHIKNWRDYPHLRADPGNLAPEHLKCNQAGGVRSAVDLGVTSREW